jgi:hypothetical protein
MDGYARHAQCRCSRLFRGEFAGRLAHRPGGLAEAETADRSITQPAAARGRTRTPLSISPRIALYMGEPNEPIDLPVEAMTADAATYLNQKIGEATFTQIDGQTRDPLAAVKEHLRR